MNPYGFAHLRRFNEDNVDLNRSFLDGPRPVAPAAYRYVSAFLNPPSPPRRDPFFAARAVWLMLRHGAAEVRQAAVGGQYVEPRGLFYGGAGVSATRDVLESSLPGWLGGARRVVHLDFHTGLGRWGRGVLLTSFPDGSPEAATLRTIFGHEFVHTPDHRARYQATGDLGELTAQLASRRGLTYLYACAEFGTFPGLAVLRALRDENRAHHWCPPADPRYSVAKRRLSEVFCPADPRWRNACVLQALQMVDAAGRWLDDFPA